MPATRNDIQPTANQPCPCPGPKDYQNKTDKFFSAFGVMYVIVNSRKDKDKALKEHVLKDIVPRGFNARINKIQEEHQRAIEEEDAARALLSDDLQNREYENVALQAQRDGYQAELQKCQDTITHLKTRYVPHARDPDKDNITIARKHTTSTNDKYDDLPYYISRIKQRKRHVKLRWFDRHFPDHEIIVEIDNPGSIHAINQFEEEGHAERKYNPFRLIDLTREELHAMRIPAILDDDEEE